MQDDYQTYLKIVSWEDFHPKCNKRKFRKLCPLIQDKMKSCTKADKETMLRCPVWKTFRNFYNGKIFQAIKKGELNGRCIKEKEVEKGCAEHKPEYHKIQRRQLQNT